MSQVDLMTWYYKNHEGKDYYNDFIDDIINETVTDQASLEKLIADWREQSNYRKTSPRTNYHTKQPRACSRLYTQAGKRSKRQQSVLYSKTGQTGQQNMDANGIDIYYILNVIRKSNVHVIP